MNVNRRGFLSTLVAGLAGAALPAPVAGTGTCRVTPVAGTPGVTPALEALPTHVPVWSKALMLPVTDDMLEDMPPWARDPAVVNARARCAARRVAERVAKGDLTPNG